MLISGLPSQVSAQKIWIWSGHEANHPINHMVVMVQLMRISLNVHLEVMSDFLGSEDGFSSALDI